MPLVDLDISFIPRKLPANVRSFLREADRRIASFQRASGIPAFVPSDFRTAYDVLSELSGAWATTGALFCEWGSGFGVVACLAAMLEFDACGIEIEAELVDAAQDLADDFDLPVRFVRGSFIPSSASFPNSGLGTSRESGADGFAWLSTDADDIQDELGLAPDDFAVIFAYPWPDEEKTIVDLFERYAARGAVLLTYHGGDDFRARRKMRA
jgi:hypothetical protein